METDKIFATDLAGATADDWHAAVDRVLGGSSFERVLVSHTRAGLEIQPLYTGALGSGARVVPVDVDRVAHGWDVRSRHESVGSVATVQPHIIEDLERGATSIELGRPVDGWTSDQLRRTLEGVLLDLAPVALSPHASLDDAAALLGLVDERHNADATRSWLGLDPIGEVARTSTTADLDRMSAFVSALPARYPQLVGFTVDTTRYVDSGADEAQELAWMLATGVAYLRELDKRGRSVVEAARLIGFRCSVDADQFLNIARLRAARVLWSRVLSASGVSRRDQVHRIQAVTSSSMFSERDPWVNMLRSTSAVVGAGVGGADAITVLPFDGTDSGLARRSARNTQLVLIEESGLSRLVDPAAGSWFVESLTHRLADAAWTLFQQVEASGGMAEALKSGHVRDSVDRSWKTRLDRVATRQEPITGVSEFPDADSSTEGGRPASVGALGFPRRRPAAAFEHLRDLADQARLHGANPCVHIAALGSLATHTARTSWVTNLLSVGGISAIGGSVDGSESPLQAEADFAESGLLAAVICSSDEVYAERAKATARALKEAGASFVAYVGKPGDAETELRAAGVDAFWHAGVDVLDALRTVQVVLGVC